MKKWFFILLAGLSAVSCDGPEEQTAGSLSVSRTSIEFAAAGNTVETVTVTAKSVEWNFTVSPENDWLEVSRTDGGIAVTAADNTDSAVRTATITVRVKNGGNVKPQDIRVSQCAADPESGNYAVNVDLAELSFEGTDSSVREVVVTTEGDGLEWTLEIDEEAREWLYAEKGDGRFSVTVSDNTGTQERAGIIRVVPDIESVPGKAVRVTQGITPSLTAEIQPDGLQGNPLVFPAYVFDEFALIYVNAVGVGVDYRIEYEEGNNTPWVKVIADINGNPPYINIKAAGNPLEEKRFAELVIFPTEKVEGVEEIRFAIEQEAGRSTLSNLVENVEVLGLAVNWTTINPTRPGIDIDRTLWTVELWSGTVEGDAASWPKKFSGSGNRIYLSFCSTKIEKNDDGIYELPEGTYTVADEEGPMKVKKGYMNHKDHPECCGDSWFFRLENDVYVAEAPIVGGSMEVSREGAMYTVTFDFVDDRGYSITGSYTGGLDVHPQW